MTPELTVLGNKPIDVSGRPDALREEVRRFIAEHGGTREIRVQLCPDLETILETMPVEDASVVWPEKKSPCLAVGRITVPPQNIWRENRARVDDNQLRFSRWQGLAAHRPPGGIMRSDREAYEELERVAERDQRLSAA